MKSPILLSLSLGFGWLLSPEALVITGNSAGHLGWLAIPLLAVVALIFAVCNRAISDSQALSAGSNELSILQESIGRIPAAGLTISSCLPLLILAATALLVTSGYTFNEVFLYWFPNFGFAFLLLGLLTLLQFLPMRHLQRAQLGFVGLAAIGLLILAVYGSLTPAKPFAEIIQQPEHLSSAALSSALLLLLFAGSHFSGGQEGRSYLIPVIALFVFSLWMFASLCHVDPERLASSTIPYMTASRKILGDTGRQIMGAVVISGSCAAITGLSLLCRQKLSDLAHANMAPQFLANGGQRWLFPPLVAIATASLMATGLAGDELLEILLQSALLLWLLYYCFLSLSAIRTLKKEMLSLPLPAYVPPLVLLAGWISIVFANPHKKELLTFIICTLVASSFIAAVWFFINPGKKDVL